MDGEAVPADAAFTALSETAGLKLIKYFPKHGDRRIDSGRDSKLGPASTQRQANRGFVPDVQPEDPRLAPILRAILSLGAVSADASTGSIAGPLGRAEVQEAAWSSAKGDTLGRAYLETRSEVVGALAIGCAAWLH